MNRMKSHVLASQLVLPTIISGVTDPYSLGLSAGGTVMDSLDAKAWLPEGVVAGALVESRRAGALLAGKSSSHYRISTHRRCRAEQQQYGRHTDVKPNMGGEIEARSRLPRSADPMEDECALVERAKTEPSAFAELYERHADRIYSYALHCLHDRMAAEDVVGDTFLRALEHLPCYEWRGVPFSAWLFRIASNMIASRTRRASSVSGHPFTEIADRAPGPEDMLLRRERRRAVFDAISKLPLPQRQVVLLRFGEELPHKEIALIVGRSEGAVKGLLYRGLHSLARRLAHDPNLIRVSRAAA
jgi:RNA polymerase sigma-70 factor, ECF subfamily